MDRTEFLMSENDSLNYERDQNNKILASYLKKSGVTKEDIEKFMRLNFVRQQWQKLANFARNYEKLSDDDRKVVVDSCLSVEKYGEMVSGAFDFFSENASGATVNKDILALYSAINTVANASFGGEYSHISAIAFALCELVEYDNEQPQIRELTMYLENNPQFETGYFNYDIDNCTFVYIGETL